VSVLDVSSSSCTSHTPALLPWRLLVLLLLLLLLWWWWWVAMVSNHLPFQVLDVCQVATKNSAGGQQGWSVCCGV
jgi:hypothetical protein